VLAARTDPRSREIENLLGDIRSVDLDRLDAIAATTDGTAGDDSETLRAVEALALPDRDQVSTAVERLREGLRRIVELSQTPAARARMIADLLQRALRFHHDHPDEPCPVCGGRTLDAGWADQANGQVQRLLGQAEQLDQAHRAVRQAVAELRELVPTTPVVLAAGAGGTESRPAGGPDGVDLAGVRGAWQGWDHLLRGDDPQRVADEAPDRFDALAAALHPVREAARQALHARQQAWQPVVDQVRAWTDTARASRLAADRYAAARKAVEWLRGVGERIRNDQLAPLAAEAAEIWRLLRQDSNVDLGDIQLAGTGTRRRVDLNVAVDGEPGAALGVMSQGELHALALSLFLPRATLAASPFRFLIIDDPVQSMDPAKVHGLAKVLERVAKPKQVIVFTHDDRLPTAIRHLGIKAHLRVVSRRERSQVSVDVDRHGDPALRYLDDARAVAKDEQVDLALRTKVACVLVRDAIEARCHDVVIARGLRAGRPIAEVEQQLVQVTRVREALALALLGDPAREPDLDGRLRQLHPRAPEVVKAANKGSHPGRDTGSVIALISDGRLLVDRLVLR
jgi:hypothetical protein